MQYQNSEARKRIASLESEIKGLEIDQEQLRNDLRLYKEDSASRSDSLRKAQGELKRVRSQAGRDVEMYENTIEELQYAKKYVEWDLQNLREQLNKEEETTSAISRSLASSPTNGSIPDHGSALSYVQPKGDVSSMPKRPGFDPEQPGGIPTWALGQHLYEAVLDHWHESMIKQLLLRAQIAQYNKNAQKALNLTLEAGGHAFILNNMPLLARCSYYRGCAEYALHRYRDANLSLEEAQAAKGRYIEGEWCQRSLRLAKLKYTREREKEGLDGLALNQSLLDEVPTFAVNGMDMLVLATSRWLVDKVQEPPRQLSVRITRQQLHVGAHSRHASESVRNGRVSSAPPSSSRRRQLETEDESVLLRPPDAPDDGYARYYNAIIPAQKRQVRHKRNASSMSNVSRMSAIEDNISAVSDVEVWRKGDCQRHTYLPSNLYDTASMENLVNGDPAKGHRKRPSQLDIADISNTLRLPTRHRQGLSGHYDQSDADDSPEVATFTFPQRDACPNDAAPRLDNLGKAPATPDPMLRRIKQHRPTDSEKAMYGSKEHDTAHVPTPVTAMRKGWVATAYSPSPRPKRFARSPAYEARSPADTLPNILRAESAQTALLPRHHSVAGEAPASSKAARILGIAVDRRSSLRDLGGRDEYPIILERRVSFAKSPTKRRKPSSAKRASFPAPWTPPPPAAESPTSDIEWTRPLLPPKGLPSPHSHTSGTPPETPRFVIVKHPQGKWRLEPEAKTPSSAPLNISTDLESELTDLGEDFSPDSPWQSANTSPTLDVSSPIEDRFDGVAVSTALEPTPTPDSLKPRSPRTPRPAGIDTVLANTGGSAKRADSKVRQEVQEGSQGGESDEIHQQSSKSPHVKFAGKPGDEMPSLERRVSTNAERYTPKNFIHRSPLPQTPGTASSSYTSRESSPLSSRSPYGPPLSASAGHQRSASVATYSPVPLSRSGTFTTPLSRTFSSSSHDNLSPGNTSPGLEGRRRPSPLKRASLASFPILSASPGSGAMSPRSGAGSPAPPGSPAVERTREKRESSWGWKTLTGLMSPAIDGFKKHSMVKEDDDTERDEEAELGVEDEGRQDDAGRFSDEEEDGGVKLKRKAKANAVDDFDEEAGIGAQDVNPKLGKSDEVKQLDSGRSKRQSLLPTSNREVAKAVEGGKMPGNFGEEEGERSDTEDAVDRV